MPNRLRPIEDPLGFPAPPETEAPAMMAATPQPNAIEDAATSILFTALKALSQRTLIAISNLFVLAAAGSAFWLWLVTLPSPSIQQLVGLGLYGLLMLALVHLVLRRR